MPPAFVLKVSQFPLIFNYRENFAEVRSASFLLYKGFFLFFKKKVSGIPLRFGVPRRLAASWTAVDGFQRPCAFVSRKGVDVF
jgi:hypothetical protein